jgi:ribonucleoside-diphosphate reductase alpha chain
MGSDQQVNNIFRTIFGKNIFKNKYELYDGQVWTAKASDLVDGVCGTMFGKSVPLMLQEDLIKLEQYIAEMKFIPAGRYVYYAGRLNKSWNNCAALIAQEDTREEWASIIGRVTNILMNGAGLSVEYSIFRARNEILNRTGGKASGPMALMYMLNEAGRHIMQGGSRRAALGALLYWMHGDIYEFMHSKDWYKMPLGNTGFSIGDLKEQDFNFPAPLDMTNISVRYDDVFLEYVQKCKKLPRVFIKNVRQALKTAEPGFSFNFGDDKDNIGRNVCMEFTTDEDNDLCNLGSVNFSRIVDLDELRDVVRLASMFLICGSIRADLPYEGMQEVRERTRKIGLGIMGVHEWLLLRGDKYEVTPELHEWLAIYEIESKHSADAFCDWHDINHPTAYRAIAPTGSIGILAGTTGGIEPLYAIAYKRRYLVGQDEWNYEYVIDNIAKMLVEEHKLNPKDIDTALSLASDVERRIKFQADVQDYVDMAISSTINLPAWGTEFNNEDRVQEYADLIFKYAPRLRGLTFYPDGSRGGQPLTEVDYYYAKDKEGVVYSEHDVCDIAHGGSCSD